MVFLPNSKTSNGFDGAGESCYRNSCQSKKKFQTPYLAVGELEQDDGEDTICGKPGTGMVMM